MRSERKECQKYTNVLTRASLSQKEVLKTHVGKPNVIMNVNQGNVAKQFGEGEGAWA